MTRNDTRRIIPLLIWVLIIPVQSTVFEQDNMIEFLLRKVAELENNQRECSSYQSRMLSELNYVKDKLEQSERRITELENIVYDIRSADYTENVNISRENDPVYDHADKDITNVILEEKTIRHTLEPKGLQSHKPGIFERKGREMATQQIGFYAAIVNSIATLHTNEIVHFDTVLHDEGNGFNKQTGVFTCLLSGTYFFSLSLVTPNGYQTGVHLMVNGQIKGSIIAYGSNSLDQGSTSCILRCEAGQNVWVSVSTGIYIYGDYYSSFSGFLLWGDTRGSR